MAWCKAAAEVLGTSKPRFPVVRERKTPPRETPVLGLKDGKGVSRGRRGKAVRQTQPEGSSLPTRIILTFVLHDAAFTSFAPADGVENV